MNRILPRLLLTPAVATLFLWMLVPLLMTLYFSVIRFNLLQPDQIGFVGFPPRWPVGTVMTNTNCI
jgi:sorbitol/mannitol transport system permease protein